MTSARRSVCWIDELDLPTVRPNRLGQRSCEVQERERKGMRTSRISG